MNISTDEKDWIEEVNTLCVEHLDHVAPEDDAGIVNLCSALVFLYDLLDFNDVQGHTLH